MAKIKAPLFSLDATGTLDKNITYKGLKQNHIAQKYSQPGSKNPFESSPRQKDQRSIIRLITIHWQCMASADKLAWETAAKDARFKGTGYHYFLSKAQQNLTQYLGLVGYWSMNYNIDDKIPDLSGNGNHGTLSPIYPCDAPILVDSFDKKLGKALSFDGITHYLSIGPAFPKPLHWTVMALIKPSVSVDGSIAESQNGGYTEWGPRFMGTVLRTYITNQTLSQAQWVLSTIGPADIPVNSWAHIAVTVDGSYIRFYLNGLLHDSIPQTVQNIGPTVDISIGRMGGSNHTYFNGAIDDVPIYNTALSPEEVKRHSPI